MTQFSIVGVVDVGEFDDFVAFEFEFVLLFLARTTATAATTVEFAQQHFSTQEPIRDVVVVLSVLLLLPLYWCFS